MKKSLLFLLMMALPLAVQAQEEEVEQTDIDSLVISKVVRMSKDLEDSYQSIQNPYGTGASNGVSSSGIGGGGNSGGPVTSDTLVMTRVDDNSIHSIVSADTVFFRHAVDPFHNQLKDSIFVTRFTRALQTGESSSETNLLKLDVKMSGTLHIYALPLGNYTDRTIKVTQYGQTILESVVSGEPVGTETVDLDFFGQAMNIMGTEIAMETGKFNYNLTNPQSNKTMADVDVYPVLSVRVAEGEITIEYPVGTMKIYGFEIIQTGESKEILPALLIYPGRDGIIKNGVENDFLNTAYSSDAVPCIGFNAAYTENTDNIELFVPGQFKKGDVIRITGVYYSDNTKDAKLSLFTVEDGHLALVAPTEQLINAKSSKSAPEEEVFTLTRDYERLFIGRNNKTAETAVYLTALRVEGMRSQEEIDAYAATKAEFEAVATAREDLIPLQEAVEKLKISEEAAACTYKSVKAAVAEAENAITTAKDAVQNVSNIIDAGNISTTNKDALDTAFADARQAIDNAKQAIADAEQTYSDAKDSKPVPGDITGTGEVTSDDFDKFAQDLINGTLPEEGDEDFERYDANGDGYVDISDLQAIMNLSLDLNADGSTK